MIRRQWFVMGGDPTPRAWEWSEEVIEYVGVCMGMELKRESPMPDCNSLCYTYYALSLIHSTKRS